MSEETVTTEDVRDRYADFLYVVQSEYDMGYEHGGAEFDRWLAEHDRAVAEAAIRALKEKK